MPTSMLTKLIYFGFLQDMVEILCSFGLHLHPKRHPLLQNVAQELFAIHRYIKGSKSNSDEFVPDPPL
jgi:hypothetical protein